MYKTLRYILLGVHLIVGLAYVCDAKTVNKNYNEFKFTPDSKTSAGKSSGKFVVASTDIALVQSNQHTSQYNGDIQSAIFAYLTAHRINAVSAHGDEEEFYEIKSKLQVFDPGSGRFSPQRLKEATRILINRLKLEYDADYVVLASVEIKSVDLDKKFQRAKFDGIDAELLNTTPTQVSGGVYLSAPAASLRIQIYRASDDLLLDNIGGLGILCEQIDTGGTIKLQLRQNPLNTRQIDHGIEIALHPLVTLPNYGK